MVVIRNIVVNLIYYKPLILSSNIFCYEFYFSSPENFSNTLEKKFLENEIRHLKTICLGTKKITGKSNQNNHNQQQ